MLEFILNLLATKVAFYLVVAYNIGLLVYLGVEILKDNGRKNEKNS